LLAIDLQDSFIDSLPDSSAFLNRCAFAIQAAETLGLRVVFTEQSPEKLGPANAKLLSLARQPKRFAKRSFSALQAPGLIDYLRQKEVYHLLICGLETPICIYQTGLQAQDADLEATLLADAIAGFRPEDAPPVLDNLRTLGCNVLPAETVFYSLLGDADNPYFRPFSELVKRCRQPNFDLEFLAPPSGGEPREHDALASRETEGLGDADAEQGRGRRRSRSRRGRRGRSRRDGESEEPPLDHGERRRDRERSPETAAAPSEAEPRNPERPPQPQTEAPSRGAPGEESATAPPAAEPSAPPPAKKAAKKTAKKAARKRPAAKKSARKAAAKKAARKTASKRAAAPSSSASEAD